MANIQLPVYFCPSDRKGMWKGDGYVRTRGNYVLDWGYFDYYQTQPAGRKTGPFSANKAKMACEISDGLSNTIFMSEIVQALLDEFFDFRGDFLNNDMGCCEIHDALHAKFGYRLDVHQCTGIQRSPVQLNGRERSTSPHAAGTPGE